MAWYARESDAGPLSFVMAILSTKWGILSIWCFVYSKNTILQIILETSQKMLRIHSAIMGFILQLSLTTG